MKASYGIAGIIAAVFVGAVIAGGLGDLPYLAATDKPDDPEPSSPQDVVQVNDYLSAVDAEVLLQDNASAMDAYLFPADNAPSQDRPVYLGDYVDFSATEATDGLVQGEDYFKESISNSDQITFDGRIKSGSYKLVLVDTANTRDYHYAFMEVSMPDTITETRLDKNPVITLAEPKDVDKFASYDSDDTVTVNTDTGDTTSLSANMDDPSSNVTDRARTIQRSISLDTGVDYLGEYVVTNFNADDGVSTVEVSLETEDGDVLYAKELKDGDSGELSDSTSFSEAFPTDVEDVDRNPATNSEDVVLTVDLVYDANTVVTDAGDGEIGPGESALDFYAKDIYGNKIGTAGTTSITG